MATRKSTNKSIAKKSTSKNVTTKMTTRKLKTETNKQLKKRPWIIILIIFFAVAAVGGFFAANVITKNDTFEIIGEQIVYIEVGASYQEEGVKIISFGRDISDEVKIESNLDETKVGEYCIKYTVEDIRFGNVCRYRYVIVQGVSNEE